MIPVLIAIGPNTNAQPVENFGMYTSSDNEECDCGCQDPAFTTPEEAVVFLYNRFTHAGVSDAVAKAYARDLKKITDSPEFYNP